MRTIFMGTPQFAATILDALLRSSCQVCAVYTQPDKPAGRGRPVVFSPVKKLALEQQIPVVQPETLKPSEVLNKLTEIQPDLIVVAAYGAILPPDWLCLPRFGCLAVHPSILPRHRGPSPVANSILCGDEITGVTIILMDAGVDTGPIIAQENAEIACTDTTGSLSKTLAGVGAKLLLEILPRWLNRKLTPQAQEETGVIYSKLISSEDAEIDWHLSAVEIWRQVRAYNPWPVSYTCYQGKRLRIHRAIPCSNKANGEIGKVIVLPESPGVGVVTGEGVLGLCDVQLEGKRQMSAGDFVRGKRDFIGCVLSKGAKHT